MSFVKRILSLILALVLVIILIPARANAKTFDGFVYTPYEDHVEITDYTGGATEVVIPSEIEGLPVTTIGERAFIYRNEPFDICGKITSVDIPDSVTTIADNAFWGCRRLTHIKMTNRVSYIGEFAFNACDNLTSIDLPDSLTSISNGTFADCYHLTSIDLPDKLTSIGDFTFTNCESLRNIDFPDSVVTIGDGAFLGCQKLKTIYIPDSVVTIGDGAFMGCQKLTEIRVAESNQNYSNDDRYVLFDKEKTALLHVPGALTGSYVIPEGVITIGNNAFSWIYHLTSIAIPGSVTRIGSYAFSDCDRLSIIHFRGDAPEFEQDIFTNVTATAYYPDGNNTWTADLMQNYGGKITWLRHDANHDYTFSQVITAPTCTGQGYTTYTCGCGESYVGNHVDALGHAYKNGTCTVCGVADPDYEAPAIPSFTDVPAGAYYEAPVLWAVENGITSGATENSFNPGGACLRAHVVTFLWRAAKQPEPAISTSAFTDVKSTDFFFKPVLWAVEQKITSGVSATEFGSYANCNRAAVVTFLWRAAGSPEPRTNRNPFTDVKKTDFFYKPVLWAVEYNITAGLTATTFGPTAGCNRAQVVTFLYRAFN